MRKIKKLYQKQQLINDFVDQYNQTFGAQLFYTEPNNNSSRYLETGTVIDQSQLNNSSVSGSSLMQSIKKKKTQHRESLLFKPNGDVIQQNFSKQKTLGISTAQINNLITSPLRFETLIGVHRLIKKFIKNMYQVINKRRNSIQKSTFINSNDFYLSGNNQQNFSNTDTLEYPNQNQKISYSEIIGMDTPQSQNNSYKNSKTQQRVFINRDTFSGSPSSIQLQKVPSTSASVQFKKEQVANGKNTVHKKSSFLLKTHQQLENVSYQQDYLNDKYDPNSSINNLNEFLSGRSTQKAIFSDIQDQSDNHRYYPPLISPSPSDIQQYNNMSNTAGYNFEFSNRNDHLNGQYDQQLNNIDQYFSSDQPNDYQRNECKDSNYSSQLQNNEDQENFYPSTKYPSSMQNSNKKINLQSSQRPSLLVQNSKLFRDFSQANNQDDMTGMNSPHIKSDIHLINDNQQKFFHQESSEYNKQQTISLIETLSPQKQGKYNLKKYTTNYLQQVKESQLENSGIQGKNKQSLHDEFEKQFDDDEDRSTSRKKKKILTETIFAAENIKKQKEINDQQSVNSAMSQTYSKKLQVVESITSTDKPLLIVSIQLAGIVAFLFMVTVTSGIFIYLNTIFKENVNDFNNLLVGPQLQSDYAYILKEREVLNFLQLKKLDSLTQSKTFIENNQKSILENFKEGMKLLFKEREGTDFSVRVNNDRITVNYYLLLNKKNPLDYVNLNYPMKFLINYSILILYTHMSLIIIPDKQFPNSSRYVEKNMIEYFKEFQTIQTITRNQSLQEVNNMEQNIIISISIMEGVAILVLIIGLPIYSKIQSSREKWLKLFATWSQSKLQEMISKIDFYITEEYGTLKQLERQTNNKRKTVSSTTNLNRFSGIIFLAILLCLVLVSIYPVINLIFTQDFVTEFNYSIKEITSIYQTRAQFNTEFSLIFLISNSLYQDIPVSQDILDYYTTVHEQNKENIQTLYYMSEHFQNKRYQKQKYINFLLTALNENVCDIFSENSQYFPTPSNIDLIKCKILRDKLFTKGIIASLKQIQTDFKNLQEIISSSKDFKKNFETWVKESEMNSLFEVQRQLSDYLSALQIFLMNMTVDYRDYITTIQYWLYFYSLFVLIAIFLIGFSYFVKRLTDSLYQTRFLLTLFKVDTLIENPYIMSFLSDERSKGKLK